MAEVYGCHFAEVYRGCLWFAWRLLCVWGLFIGGKFRLFNGSRLTETRIVSRVSSARAPGVLPKVAEADPPVRAAVFE